MSDMEIVAPEVIEVENLAADAKLAMAPILRAVGVSPTTWWRWRHGGVGPRIATLRKVRHELVARIAANDTQSQSEAA